MKVMANSVNSDFWDFLIMGLVSLLEGEWHNSVTKNANTLAGPMKYTLLIRWTVCLLLASAGSRVYAQDLEPRLYTNLPVGQKFVGVVYAFSSGELTPAPSVPLEDTDLDVHSTVVAYVQTFALADHVAKIDANWGVQCFEGSGVLDGTYIEGERCGSLDPRVRLSFNFVGERALTLEEFVRERPRGLVIGSSLQVGLPLGTYKDDKIINSSSNRWFLKPEVGLSNSFGNWSIDLALSARIFGDNEDFIGDRTLKQDNIYALQAHVIYGLSRGRWIALNANYFHGGKTTKDGFGSGDLQKNSRYGMTYAWPLNSRHTLKFLVHSALATSIGNDFTTAGLAWQYRWGN
jgi:hypothetical protein